MEQVFHIKAKELGLPFLEKLRALYGDEDLEISVASKQRASDGGSSQKGLLLKDLPNALKMAREHAGLTDADMEDFAKDVNEYRNWANTQTMRDPWEPA